MHFLTFIHIKSNNFHQWWAPIWLVFMYTILLIKEQWIYWLLSKYGAKKFVCGRHWSIRYFHIAFSLYRKNASTNFHFSKKFRLRQAPIWLVFLYTIFLIYWLLSKYGAKISAYSEHILFYILQYFFMEQKFIPAAA